MKCKQCDEIFPLKSNLAVAEELARLTAFLQEPEPSCPNPACPNHAVPVSAGMPYYKAFGRTHSGSQRFRCLTCRKTFALSKPGQRQRKSFKNIDVFDRLMGKQPFARICQSLGISMITLYGKIEFFYKQAQAFAADRERRLLMEGPIRDRLYVCVDRQDYVSNWTQRSDRRNVHLMAIGSADLTTGYVFGMDLNYDNRVDFKATDAAAQAAGDYGVPAPFRKFARVWLPQDYALAVANSKLPTKLPADLTSIILQTYADAVQREDVESGEIVTRDRKLPGQGAQVHLEYTMYAHFFYLAMLFKNVSKVRFYCDQESGIRAAMLAAFQERVKRREVDAFYVSIKKELMVWEKQKALAESRREFARRQAANPQLSATQIELEMVKENMRHAKTMGKWKDRWVTHPLPNMSEPEKALCYLTDYGDYTEDHLAKLYLRGSLHAIDRFFMQVRRRLSLLERPIGSASAARRMWYGYSAYNPSSIEKLLAIFRVYYNYVLIGQDRQTAAMRLGLARGPVTIDDILRFDKYANLRKPLSSAAKAKRQALKGAAAWLLGTEP